MKIIDRNAVLQDTHAAIRPEDKKAAMVTNDFKLQLGDVTRDNYEERLHELAEKVLEQGERLSSRADIAELKRYREMLSEYVSYAIKYSFDCDTHGGARRGNSLITIKRIDVNLDRLTAEILKNEEENLRIASLVDDIRGLVLDMLT